MNQETTEQQQVTQPATQQQIALTIKNELVKNRWTEISAQVSSFQINEGNLDDAKKILEFGAGFKKLIDKAHKEGKEPSLKEGQKWDMAKRELLAMVDGLFNPFNASFQQKAKEVAENNRLAALEIQRIDNIKKGIEVNLVAFSGRIAASKTLAELLQVEKIINLEKGRTDKYQEFLEEAKEKFSTLTASIAVRKKLLKDLEITSDVKDSEDEYDRLQRENELADKQNLLEEHGQTVQQNAINTAMDIGSSVEIAAPIMPFIDPKRTVWKTEIVDIKKTLKEKPDWVKIELDSAKVKDHLKQQREAGVTTEFTVSGVRFFPEQIF